MKIVLPAVAVAAIALSACSPNTRNETAEAGNAIAADAAATTENAVNDVEAARHRGKLDAVEFQVCAHEPPPAAPRKSHRRARSWTTR